VTSVLPHINGLLNLLITILVAAGYLAIRRGRRTLHARLMKLALSAGVVFLALKSRFSQHRRIAGFTIWGWLYVASTGVVIYWMNVSCVRTRLPLG